MAGLPAGAQEPSRDMAYAFALFSGDLLPLAAAVLGGVVLAPLVGWDTTLRDVSHTLEVVPLMVLVMSVTLAGLFALVIRAAGGRITPGFHPDDGKVAFCSWLTAKLLRGARTALFPLYAGLLTPFWLRLLGARVGPRAEVSTSFPFLR